jgi:hypothetical protein
MKRLVNAIFVVAAFLLLLSGNAYAQQGQVTGTVRDSSGAVIPGVLVETTSPALIEKVRSSTTDGSGQYRITNLPVGIYTVTFTLQGFTRQQRDNIELTSGFTASVNATMTVGQLTEVVTVVSAPPTVDVQSARQVTTFSGAEIRDLPTARTMTSLMALTPGLTQGVLAYNCVGGAGVWCNPNIYGFNAHASLLDTDGLNQGRIMVDGSVINSGSSSIQGSSGGYGADIANAQEVNIQIAGALGESETGGSAINIVPRTGGNRFSGNYFSSYTRKSWFDTNTDAYPTLIQPNLIKHDHDVSASFGGPIKRDRLWFYSVGRLWGKEQFQGDNQPIFNNLNSGKAGANYQPDRSQEALTYTNLTRSINARITYQATQKNKINIFWDEQLTCLDPCDGTVASWVTPESTWSGQVHPARLQQVSWTNPFTNRVLFEAGVSVNTQLYDLTHHRYAPAVSSIPRIQEVGDTAGGDAVASRVNTTAGASAFSALASGPLNSAMGSGGAETRDLLDFRPRASVAYVSGTHSAKLGYDGGYYSQNRRNQVNDLRLTYRYDTPLANCANTLSCGNTSLYYPNDPNNFARRPVPSRVTINTGAGDLGYRVRYNALYAQDQWTMKRLTLSGALRYDHATSRYLETCVGPDKYVPLQSTGGNSYCTPPSDGVSYNDITPRWSLGWDVFGNGKTAVKWSMGKYLSAAAIDGIYQDANPGQRTVNSLERGWTDNNGNRVVDCDLLNFAPNGECQGPSITFPAQDPIRYGRDPLSLDEAGTPIGLATTQCGRREKSIPAEVQAYCDKYDDTLLDGWGRRRYEWQWSLGVQHEILPRLSGEVTFNRRKYGNLSVMDQLGIGCDRFNGAQDVRACQDGFLNYTGAQFDFFTVTAPSDPRLPNGGGYRLLGNSNAKATLPTGRPTAVTLMKELDYWWSGVDTNFVWRAPGGLRLNGGTSTGRAYRDTCYTELDEPHVNGREGNDYHGGGIGFGRGGCRPNGDFRTNVRGSATYTLPKVDVLVSTVFQYRPGIPRSAIVTYAKEQVAWDAPSASRATAPCVVNGVATTGCFTASGTTVTATTYQVNLLDLGDLYGENTAQFDLKLAKNIRFANKRLNIGVDVYNLMNSDAIIGYNETYTLDNPATPAVEVNSWGLPGGIGGGVLSPRFVRLQVQFDF